jgi:hypothetical protein
MSTRSERFHGTGIPLEEVTGSARAPRKQDGFAVYGRDARATVSALLRAIGVSLAALFCAAGLQAEPGITRGKSASSSNAHGRAAISSFNLDTPDQPPETPMQTVGDVMGKVSRLPLPSELLRPSGGRVQLFSIARLTEQDMTNPFEIRVQVAVDVQETEIEIGGIVEGINGQRSTAILTIHPPNIRSAGTSENTPAKSGARPAAAQGGNGKPIPRVCSVGDVVDGFRVYMILRDSVVLEQAEKLFEVPRGQPVTVSVPLSAL